MFQSGHSRFRIEQLQAYRNLAEISSAEESEGRLLCVVQLVPPGFSLRNDALHMLEAAINEGDTLPADRQPAPPLTHGPQP